MNNANSKEVSFILLAGGVGKRMRQDCPKQFLMLAGKPIIMHTLDRIDMIPTIGEVIIVCPEEHREHIENLRLHFGLRRNFIFAPAGATRQESVFNGLRSASRECIVIHEAARPFVKKEEFEALIEASDENVIYASPINYTVLQARDGAVVGNLKRSELINVQLPHKYSRERLLSAHIKAAEENLAFTEDAGLLFTCAPQTRIRTLAGTPYNLKITENIDLLLGEIIYREFFAERR